MARIQPFESLLGVILAVTLVSGLPLSVEKRDMSKDKAVREMYELLHARRQLESEQINTEAAPSPTVRPTSLVEEHTYLSSGGSSLTQLCTDAVTFLSNGDSDHEKRNLVINHVYNLCIRPGSKYDVVELMRVLQGAGKDEDWSNWPGFDYPPTATNVPTTTDIWKQLLDEFFNVDIIGEQDGDDVTTSAPSLYSTMESLDALLGDFINMLEEEYGEVTAVPATPSEPSELEASLEEFLHLLEEEEAQKTGGNDVTSTTTQPRTTTGAEPSTTPQTTTDAKASTTEDLEEVLNEIWSLIEDLEGESASASPTTAIPQATAVAKSSTTNDIEGALNDFWNMIDQQGQGGDPRNDVVVTSSAPADNNEPPPIDLNKRNGMKKRLLKMLAKTLAEKDAMRK